MSVVTTPTEKEMGLLLVAVPFLCPGGFREDDTGPATSEERRQMLSEEFRARVGQARALFHLRGLSLPSPADARKAQSFLDNMMPKPVPFGAIVAAAIFVAWQHGAGGLS